jgi:hypothetical protein
VAASIAATILGLWIGASMIEDPLAQRDPRGPIARNVPIGADPAGGTTFVAGPASVPIVPVADTGDGGGLRRLRPGERQMREDALLIRDTTPFSGVFGSGSSMVPAGGLQRVGGPR